MGCIMLGRSAKQPVSVCLSVTQGDVKSLMLKLLCDPWSRSAKAWHFIRRTVGLLALLLFVVPAETPVGKDFHLLFYSWENRGLNRLESVMQTPTCTALAQELLVPITERFQS